MTPRRNRRAGVEDRWHKADGCPSANDGKGKRWRARYVDDVGRELSKAFDRKIDAQRWLDAEVTTALVTGTYVEPNRGLITVGELFERWIVVAESHLAPGTARNRRISWRCHAGPRWADVPVAQVRKSEVRVWTAAMVSSGVSVHAVRNAVGLLRMLCRAAIEDSRIVRNPCDGVELPRAEHRDRGYLTHAQVALLTAQVHRHPEVVRFLAYTGLRWGEMAALRVCDFDMLRRVVNVSRSVSSVAGKMVWGTPKTGERRSVPFPASLAEELAALMVGKGRDELVFTSPTGRVLRGSLYRLEVFGPAVARCQQADATFPRITPHDLRHTAVSLAISAGANVKAVQRMLGHAKASMTLDVYGDLFTEDLEAVADRLDTAMRAAAADSLRTGPVS